MGGRYEHKNNIIPVACRLAGHASCSPFLPRLNATFEIVDFGGRERSVYKGLFLLKSANLQVV